MTEQMLLLVDKNDRFLWKYAPKSQCHQGKGLHHRAFTILIRNKKGEVLLQKRRHKIWDGFWDLTNSHPLHKEDGEDETYEEAARRCLKREWGIEIPVKKLFGFNYFARYDDSCENEYCAFLVGEYEGEVYPNPEVAYDYKWLLLNDLVREIKAKPCKYTPWLIRALAEREKKKRGENGYLPPSPKHGTADNQDELFVVVDKADNIIGYQTRKKCHQDKTLIHRSVGVVITNLKGEILLQKRSATKDLYPGLYTISSSGHLRKGEDYERAAERETKEELGISRRLNFKFFKKIIVSSERETEMYTILLAENDGPFSPNRQEITFVKFYSKDMIKQLFEKGSLLFEPYAKRTLEELGVI